MARSGSEPMRYISVFSGIEAASVAWEPLSWEPVCFCEIDDFPSAVLAHRYPNVPNLGDITMVDWKEVISKYGAVDVVVGGSPCQSFSIAGGREGLDGESRLMYEYIRCVQEVRPRWFLWENVPGVFSTDAGRAFGILLDAMDELGYGLAWRVLDAQFFGVAQRRRRVFLVGCLGEGGASAAVLFEPESVSGNTQSSREKRQELTRAVEERARSGGFKFHQGAGAGGVGYETEQSPTLTADYHNPACLTPWDAQSKRIFDPSGVAPTLNSGDREGGSIEPSVLAFAQNTRDEVRIQADGTISGALSASPGMKQTTYVAAMPFNPAQITSPQNGSRPQPNDPCQTLDTDSRAAVVYSLQSDGSTSINSHGAGFNDDGSAYTLNLIDRQSVVCIEGEDDYHGGVVNALCAADAKGVGNQYVNDGKLICQKTTC